MNLNINNETTEHLYREVEGFYIAIDDKGILKDNDQKLRKSAGEHFYTAYFKYILQSNIRK